MNVLGIDLGGTKLALALFNETGNIIRQETMQLEKRKGKAVGELITKSITQLALAGESHDNIDSIGISVPGIYHPASGSVWAPNVAGWDDYPLLQEIKSSVGKIPVTIDSDRACYILGEAWQGNARHCRDAIFLAIGTGIGAGILIDGNVLRGAHDIAGAIGWMGLKKPFVDGYIGCGCFENHASGEGIAKSARKLLRETTDYKGELNNKSTEDISSHDVFTAYENNDPVARSVIEASVEFWGMASANLVSLFNPEKIIFGGGVFGPAISLIPAIKAEAMKWGQPVSMKKVSFEASALGNDAGVCGAAYLALKNIRK